MFNPEQLDACLKCSICTLHCPVTRLDPDFPGPKYLGPERARLGLEATLPVDTSLDYCTGCTLCEVACPHGVPVAQMVMTAKFEEETRVKRPASRRLRDWAIARTDLLGTVAGALPRLTNFMLSKRPVRKLMQAAMGIDHRRDLPRYATWNFMKWARSRKPLEPYAKLPTPRKVAYFAGCFGRYNDPDLSKKVVEILEYAGVEVLVPKQQCCGLPLMANAQPEAAKQKAQFNLDQLLPLVREGYKVLYSSTSCGMMMLLEYKSLLGLAEAEELAAAMLDVSEYLLELQAEGLLPPFGPVDKTIYFHTPCHMKTLGGGLPSVELMNSIPGFRAVDMNSGCCGMAGTFGVKEEKFDLSLAIGGTMFENIERLGADVVASDCETCRMQVEQGSEALAIHPLTVVHAALGLSELPWAEGDAEVVAERRESDAL